MLLINYFNHLFLVTLSLILSQIAFASSVAGQCGEKKFQVEVINGSDIYESQFELYDQTNNKQRKLVYKTDTGVFFHIACIQDKNKHDLVLFQENCFGNGCPELNYGILDPDTNKILIKPVGWPNGNYSQVQAIIGYPPPLLSEYKKTFCCDRKQK